MKSTSIWLVVTALVVSVSIGLIMAREHGAVHNKDHKGIVIGLAMDTLKEPRWQVDQRLFVERASQLGATVEVSSANGDDTVQMRDINSMISNGVNLIVIIPHDGEGSAGSTCCQHSSDCL